MKNVMKFLADAAAEGRVTFAEIHTPRVDIEHDDGVRSYPATECICIVKVRGPARKLETFQEMNDGGKAVMQTYKLDDGAEHWVIAASTADALAVYHEMGVGPAPGDGVDPPEVLLLTIEQAERTPYFEDDPGNQVGTMQSEFERDSSRRYVGCSEW